MVVNIRNILDGNEDFDAKTQRDDWPGYFKGIATISESIGRKDWYAVGLTCRCFRARPKANVMLFIECKIIDWFELRKPNAGRITTGNVYFEAIDFIDNGCDNQSVDITVSAICNNENYYLFFIYHVSSPHWVNALKKGKQQLQGVSPGITLCMYKEKANNKNGLWQARVFVRYFQHLINNGWIRNIVDYPVRYKEENISRSIFFVLVAV